MERLKVKKEVIGSVLYISPSHTIVVTDYMLDADYNYMLNLYPLFFKEIKKGKVKGINIGGYDTDK